MITIIVDDFKEKDALLNMSKALDNFELEVKGLENGLIVANYGTSEGKTIKKDGIYTLDINNEAFDFICKLHKNPELILVSKEIIESIRTEYDNKNTHKEDEKNNDNSNNEINYYNCCGVCGNCSNYDNEEDENTYK